MLADRSIVRRLATSLTLGPALLLLALIAPASIFAAGPITSAACAPTGPTAVTCDLWAKTGTLALPGSSTPIWGFAASSGGAASLPGPVLVVNSGDAVTVHLTNQLAVTTAILFDGQPMAPDLSGVASGATKTYSFTAGAPGTYMYEAGLLPGTQYQAAKGLYGALIVRPAGGLMQANNNAATAFDDEALVILGEVDTALNNSATPASFDLRGYAPRYFLINGKAYPQTDPISTTSGNTLLLRYIDAGLQHHSMGVLGLRQSVVNDDGTALAFPRRMVAESLAPGQATDVLIDIPTTSATSTRYILHDGSLSLNNTTGMGANAGIGGMLTVIDAAGNPSGGDTVGPVTSGVAIDATTGALAASASDASTGAASVAAAEYFVDTVGAPGTGTAMTGSFPSDPASVSSTVALGSLSSGNHTVYVRAQDGLGNWGALASAAFALDTVGPATTSVALTPAAANGTVDVSLTATGDDRATGGANIAAAEYFIDVIGASGSGTPMTLSTTAAPVSSLSATVPALTVNGLTPGAHAILLHSQDARGNWGAITLISLVVDKSGPATSAVTASPNPNNGTLGVNSTNPSLRVQATFDDTSPAYVRTGELFIDSVGVNGTGIPMPPNDGLYNTVHEFGYADIPLTTIAPLSVGNHTIYVHGKDSLGNWGAMSTVTLEIDKSGPTTSGVTLNPAAANAQAVAVSATGSDAATGNHNVVSGEFFIDTTSAANGTGGAMVAAVPGPIATVAGTIPASTIGALTAGNHTLYVHSRDAAGNWGPRISVVLKIDRTAPTFSSINLTPSSIASGTASTVAHVNGSSDGASGSGVAGGEFWIANSNVPNGGGTAFNGLTATIPTGSLVPGTYTVRIRIRDVAGNWSTGTNGVRTATLTVTGPVPAAIFSDGFELNTLPGTWTSASTTSTTRLNVTTGSALAGTRGLQAQGNNNNYVQYNFGTAASPATGIYDARFLFRPNAKSSSGHDILAAATNSGFGTQVFHVRYRLSGGVPQVQVQVGATANGTWTTIAGGSTANTIEVIWQSATSGPPNPGSLRLYVNGVLSQTLATASASSIGAVRLGVVTNTGGATTSEHFDRFESKRTPTPYGP